MLAGLVLNITPRPSSSVVVLPHSEHHHGRRRRRDVGQPRGAATAAANGGVCQTRRTETAARRSNLRFCYDMLTEVSRRSARDLSNRAKRRDPPPPPPPVYVALA